MITHKAFCPPLRLSPSTLLTHLRPVIHKPTGSKLSKAQIRAKMIYCTIQEVDCKHFAPASMMILKILNIVRLSSLVTKVKMKTVTSITTKMVK